jgi:hypothetical protein
MLGLRELPWLVPIRDRLASRIWRAKKEVS